MIKNLFIASEVRSGSTYVAESIAYSLHHSYSASFWDLTREYFHPLQDHSSSQDIMEVYDRLHVNEWSFKSAKIMCGALSVICREAQKSQQVRDTFFGPDTCWVVVRRNNKIRQAVSLAYASKSGLFHYYGDSELSPDAGIAVSAGEIRASLGMILLSNEYLTNFARNIHRHLDIVYEGFIGNELEHLRSLLELMDAPGTRSDLRLEQPKLVKTASNSKAGSESLFRSTFLKSYHWVDNPLFLPDAQAEQQGDMPAFQGPSPEDKDKKIAELRDSLASRGGRMAWLTFTAHQQSDEISALRRTLRERDLKTRQLDGEIAALNEAVKSLGAQVDVQLRETRRLTVLAGDRAQQIGQLELTVKGMERKYSAQQNLTTTMEQSLLSIKASLSWKIMAPFRAVANWVRSSGTNA